MAQKHYRQITDADFSRALLICKQQASVNESNNPEIENAESLEIAEITAIRVFLVGDTRLELATSTVSIVPRPKKLLANLPAFPALYTENTPLAISCTQLR
jgi:hypothetical protein